MTSSFSYTDALTILLTSETLVFAALAVVVSFALPSTRVPNLPVSVPVLGFIAVAFVGVIGFGAFLAWWSTFVNHWPKHFQGEAIAVTIAVAVVGQPIFALLLALGLKPVD